MKTPSELSELSEAVLAHVKSKGLRALQVNDRCLLIEKMRCQIVKSLYTHPNPTLPESLFVRLYLPRTVWPDFMIYAVRPEVDAAPREYYVVPRGVLSKNTEFSRSALDQYREAWSLFREVVTPDLIERRFTELNWQLQVIIAAAKGAGLVVSLVPLRNKRPWPSIFQTRVVIADRRCTVRILSRVNPDPDGTGYGYVSIRKQLDTWGEFQLNVLADPTEPTVYVIPSNSINAHSCVSLVNKRLASFKNNWSLLTQPVAEQVDVIEW